MKKPALLSLVLASILIAGGNVWAESNAGTQGEYNVQYIKNEFAKLGYTTRTQSFSFYKYRMIDNATLSLDKQEGISLAPRKKERSSSKEVQGELVYVKKAKKNQIVGMDFKGEIVLAESGGISLDEKIDNVVEQGAVGMIYINTDSKETLVDGEHALKPIPVVSVGKNDGQALLAQWKEKKQKQVVANLEGLLAVRATSYNVIASLPANHSPSTGEIVVIG